MYAIIKIGGKQYKVAVGDELDVDLLSGSEIGSEVKLDEVLFVNTGSESIVGEPHVSGYSVTGKLIDTTSGPKITSMKYVPGNHRRRIGHRQHYSRLKITGIQSKHKGQHHGT